MSDTTVTMKELKQMREAATAQMYGASLREAKARMVAAMSQQQQWQEQQKRAMYEQQYSMERQKGYGVHESLDRVKMREEQAKSLPDLPSAGELEAQVRRFPGPRWQGVVCAEALLQGRSIEAALAAVDALNKARTEQADYSLSVDQQLSSKALLTATEILENERQRREKVISAALSRPSIIVTNDKDIT